MSEAGDAFFNADIRVLDNRRIRLGTGQDFLIYHEPDLNIIRSGTSDQDIAFQGNDGGSLITALTLDMSEAGAATFGGVATFSGRYVQFKDGSTIGGLIGTGSSLSAAGAGDLVVRTGGKLEFVTNDAWSTPRMTILSDGKVGIGTTAPAYKLDVNGAARIVDGISSPAFWYRPSTTAVHCWQPKDGYYHTTTNAHTGAIRIKLPPFHDSMVTFWVDVYDYALNESFSAYISGYPYLGTHWSYTSAVIIGGVARNFTVRFGDNNTAGTGA